MSAPSTNTLEPPVAARLHPWRQTLVITLIATAVFALLRWLPLAGGGLHYSDFGVGERGFLEFCEPGSPQFAPVDGVHSPVTLELRATEPLRAGELTRVTARLTTVGGKPIVADDLLVVHTRQLHLLVIDESLNDYQHLHPVAEAVPGSFAFTFTPERSGRYRVFADFTPRATGRALYAGAQLEVAGRNAAEITPAGPETSSAVVNELKFQLTVAEPPVRTNQTAKLILTIARQQGGVLVLEDVMGAPAHLVAFDERCSGFAHLHPAASTPELAEQTDAGRQLAFTINLPDPGRYRLWAQVQVEGQDVFAPFDLIVQP